MVNHKNNHAVIILASGLSQRLGQPKQLLRKNNATLIGHMTTLALLSQPALIVVVIPQHQPAIAEAMASVIKDANIAKDTTTLSTIKVVANPSPKSGMGESLALGIQSLIDFEPSQGIGVINRVLIMGVDQILLDRVHLQNLLATEHSVVASGYQHLDDCYFVNPPLIDVDFVNQPQSDIVGLPIAIDYERLQQWQSTLIGDKGLRQLIRALPADQLGIVINHQLSYDVDTPEQLDYFRQKNWLDR